MGGYRQHHHDVRRTYQCIYRKKRTARLDQRIRLPLAFYYSTAVMLISSLTIFLAENLFQKEE